MALVLHVQSTMFEGHWMTGGVVSALTVTVNVQVLRLVQSSVAVHVMVLAPTGNRVPEAGLQVMVGDGSRLSVAVGTG